MYNNVTPKEKQCCKQRKKRGVGFASIIFKKETGTICPLFVNTKFKIPQKCAQGRILCDLPFYELELHF